MDGKKPKFIILLYHKIGNYTEKSKFPGLYVREADFDAQINYLKKKGFKFVSLSRLKTLYDCYYQEISTGETGKGGKPGAAAKASDGGQKYAAITFDDGSKSVYSKGFKVLKDNGVNATVFMVSGLIGGLNEWDIGNGEEIDEMLGLPELKEMREYGIEIGAHTRTHPHLTRVSPREAYNEMASSREDLEKLLGVNINFLAYPYGDYDESVKQLAKKAGFEGACTTKTGIVKKGADFFALRRVAVRHNTNLFKFKRKIFKVSHFY